MSDIKERWIGKKIIDSEGTELTIIESSDDYPDSITIATDDDFMCDKDSAIRIGKAIIEFAETL